MPWSAPGARSAPVRSKGSQQGGEALVLARDFPRHPHGHAVGHLERAVGERGTGEGLVVARRIRCRGARPVGVGRQAEPPEQLAQLAVRAGRGRGLAEQLAQDAVQPVGGHAVDRQLQVDERDVRQRRARAADHAHLRITLQEGDDGVRGADPRRPDEGHRQARADPLAGRRSRLYSGENSPSAW